MAGSKPHEAVPAPPTPPALGQFPLLSPSPRPPPLPASPFCCCCFSLTLLQLLRDCSLPARLLCPWDFLDKNTGAGCHFLLQGIFLTQGSNPHLLHQQVDSLSLSHLNSPSALFRLHLTLTTILPIMKVEVPLDASTIPVLSSSQLSWLVMNGPLSCLLPSLSPQETTPHVCLIHLLPL